MKKKVGAVLTAAMLFTGVGVVTASSAQAAVRIGGYSTLAVCRQVQTAYTTYGGRTLISPCFQSGVSPYRYYFVIV